MLGRVLHLHHLGDENGAPMIALHGLTGHGRRFRALAAHLPGVRLIAPDLRGHGRSTPHPPWTLDQHVSDVLATADHLGLDRIKIIGHSLGATVAVHLARRAPDRVERLVLLDPVLALPPHLAETLAHEALTPPAYDTPAQAAEEAGNWPADEIDDHLAQSPDGRWRWRYSAPMAATGYRELAGPAVTPPHGTRTALVIARRSKAVPPDYPARCREALGNTFTVAEIDSGHHVHLEHPAETAAIVSGTA